MKHKTFIFNLILVSSIFANNKDIPVELPTSTIVSDYIEGEKLQGSKNIIIIKKSDIEGKGYTSISEILDDIPSISVGKSGWGEIDIRGQGVDQAAKNIQVMVDGAPITTLVNHPFQTNYNVIPVAQIERIEIIPGGGAVLYGNGASGGVINISTNLKKIEKPITELGYEYSDNNKKRYFVNAGTKITENLNFQLNFSKDDEDLYFVDTYRKSDYFSGGLNYKISDKQNISLKYSKFNEKGQFIKNISKNNLLTFGKDYKPSFRTVTIGVDEKGQRIQERKRGYLASTRESEMYNINYNYQLTEKLRIIVDGFKDKGYFTNNNDEDKKMNQETLGTKIKLDYYYGEKNNLLLGIDYHLQKADLRYFDYIRKKNDKGNDIKNNEGKVVYVAKELNFNYERNVKALFFLNKFGYKDFEFTQGVRQDITNWNFEKNANDGKGADNREVKNQAYELSSAWLYRDVGRIYARYERGFTGPDGVQISDRIYEAGNRVYKKTDAEDEIFDMYEIGLRDYLLGSTVNLTAFYTKTDNQLNRLSVKNSQNQLEYRSMNLLKTNRYGVEASFYQKFGKFSFEESYSWLKGKTNYNSKGDKFIAEGNKIDWEDSGLKKVPEHNIVLRVSYDFTKNIAGGIIYKYSGGYNNYLKKSEREQDSLVRSNTVTDVVLSYSNNYGITLYGGINNIFNEEYYSYISDGFATVIPSDRRTLFVGFKYKL